MIEPLSLNFRVFTVKLVGVQKLRTFYGRTTIRHQWNRQGTYVTIHAL